MRLFLVSLLIFALSAVAVAQDEDEIEAFAENLEQINEIVDSYESFQVATVTEEFQVIDITIGEETLNQSQNITRETTATVTRGEDATGLIAANIEQSDGVNDIAYGVEAEVRFVEETLYVNASYVGEPPQGGVLPEGWVVVEDPNTAFEFAELDLPSFVALVNPEEIPNPLEDIAGLLDTASEVNFFEEERGDETVNVSEALFGVEGVRVILGGDEAELENDPFFQLIVEQLPDATDLVSLRLATDEDGNIRERTVTFDILLEEFDGAALGQPGSTVTVEVGNIQSEIFDEINAEFEAVEAPEVEG